MLKNANSLLQREKQQLIISLSKKNNDDDTMEHIQSSVKSLMSKINTSHGDEKKTLLRQIKLQIHPDKNPAELRWLFDEMFKML